MYKWLPPLCLLLLVAGFPAAGQNGTVSATGWRYEVLKPGDGPPLTTSHGALTHNQLVDADGQVLISTYAIGVPDYQLIAELSEPFQSACTMMKGGSKYRFHIPVAEFKAATRGGANMNLPGDQVTWELEILQVLPPRPDVARVVAQTFRSEGAEAAYRQWQDLRAQRSAEVYFGEWEVNQLGYFFLQQGQTEAAIDILQYNAQAHPSSFNAHDSLGEAYYKAGKPTLAAQHYRRSLQLNPENDNARKMLTELE